MAVVVRLQSVLPSRINFCYISDNYAQRKHMHITIDTKSRTLSRNNKLRDYTESGFVPRVNDRTVSVQISYTYVYGNSFIVLWCEITR